MQLLVFGLDEPSQQAFAHQESMQQNERYGDASGVNNKAQSVSSRCTVGCFVNALFPFVKGRVRVWGYFIE